MAQDTQVGGLGADAGPSPVRERLDALRERGGNYWQMDAQDLAMLQRLGGNVSMMLQAPCTSSDMIGTLEHMVHLVPTTRRHHAHRLGVGSDVPDFAFVGSHGATVSLDGLRGHRPFAIRLSRGSGPSNICPRCVPGLDELTTTYSAFDDAGVELIVVLPITPAQTEMLADALDLPYPLYSDEERTLYKAFETGDNVGSPLPAWVVGDRDGVVRFLWRAADHGYDTRYVESAEILEVVQRLDRG